MPRIIRDLPFYDRPTSVEVRGRTVSIQRDQIMVWVSLSEIGLSELHPNSPRFPAVLDSGCNHCFVIRQEHLVQWARIRPEYLPRLRPTRVYGRPVPQLAANIWLHPNRPGHRDEFTGQPPVLVEAEPGIAVVPETIGEGKPRLPLLGLRAFRWNNLCLTVHGDHCCVNIYTRRRFWFFG